MYEIKLKIRREYDDTVIYEGKDILMAEALVKLAKLNPVPKPNPIDKLNKENI